MSTVNEILLQQSEKEKIEKIVGTIQNKIYYKPYYITVDGINTLLYKCYHENDTLSKYTITYLLSIIEEFININSSYIELNLGLYHCDIEKYIKVKTSLEDRKNKLQPGDMLEIHSNNGHIFHKYAHIERALHYGSGLTYCESPQVPFYIEGNCFSTSGGAWGELKPNKCTYLGKVEKLFKVWGWRGARGNGAFCVRAKVNKFKTIRDRKFIPYTVSKRDVPDQYGYIYYVENYDSHDTHCKSCFKTDKGLEDYLKQRDLKIGDKVEHLKNTNEIIGEFKECAIWSVQELEEMKKKYTVFPFLSNGSYTEAVFNIEDRTVYYCNPNVKDRVVLPYIHY